MNRLLHPGWPISATLTLMLACSDSPSRSTTDETATDTDRVRPTSDASDGAALQEDAPSDGSGDAGTVDAVTSDTEVRETDALPTGFCGDIDILFVIDSSGSMADNQASLVRSFPGFVQGMRTRLLNAPSFRVGVTSSSDVFGNAPGCTGIGSLITRTSGPRSSDRECGPYASGAAWIGHLDPQLEEHFACAAQVGVGGSDDERMMRAALNAVSPALTAPGACNEGFGRPDALLVMVLITDEDDVEEGCDSFGDCLSYGSGGRPDDWVEELAGYRGGTTDNVVVLSLVGRTFDNPCGAVVNSRLLGFARRFGENGLVGDVCADSYDAFFEEALPIIAEACAKGAE